MIPGLSADNEIACLREYYNNWQQRNPNLFLCGAYLHRDEQERQRNADITEQISYDVSDRAENFAEWEPER